MALRFVRLIAFGACIGSAACGSTAAVKGVGTELDPNGGSAGESGGQGGVLEQGGRAAGGSAGQGGGAVKSDAPDAEVKPAMDAGASGDTALSGASQMRPVRPNDEDYNRDAIAKLRFAPATNAEISQVQNNLNTLFPGKTFKSPSGATMQYRLHTPDRSSYKNKAPLLVFMHGAGERGGDNLAQVGPSVFIAGPGVLAIGERAKAMPAFILAPQCSWAPEHWDGLTAGPKEIHFNGSTKAMKIAMELVDATIKDNPTIDTRRVYVMGMSMGGFATWEMISRWPEKFAAAAPMCGGGDTNFAQQILYMPIWAFHSKDDGNVPIVWDETIINKLKSLGGTPKFNTYTGPGHIVWGPAYREPDLFPWLFSQSQ